MTALAPWVLALHAGTSSAEDRGLIARSLDARIGRHPDWVLLETCHRVELYGFGSMPELETNMKVVTGDDAVRHLIRVAAGLDSAIIG